MSRRARINAALLVLPGMAIAASAARPQDETARNRAIITRFADIMYRQKDVPRAFATYVAPGYVQHNPGLPDGPAAAVAALTPKFASPTSSFVIKRIVVDGDMAVIHLHARADPAARGSAVMDMYRLKDGRIVEHWDVLQPVPETSANPHPMF